MSKIWFKRKKYGWGWVPASSEGWLVIAAFIFGIIYYAAEDRLFDPIIGDLGYSYGIFFSPFALFVVGLAIISWVKGESPKWQWGGK